MASQYVFLWGSLALSLMWCGAYVWANPHRDIIVAGTILALPLSFLEPWFLQDYWAPASLFGWSERLGISIESAVFSFALGGLAPVAGLPFVPVKRTSLCAPQARATVLRFYLALLASMALLDRLSPLSSIYVVCLAQALLAMLCVALRPALLRPVAAGASGLGGAYFAAFVLLDVLFPDFIPTTYRANRFMAFAVGNVPLEEGLFAASAGGCWCGILLSPSFEDSARQRAALHLRPLGAASLCLRWLRRRRQPATSFATPQASRGRVRGPERWER